MKTVLSTLGIVIGLATVVALTVMYSGMFNVATEWKDPALLRWVLVTTRESSIESRAKNIQVPALEGNKRIENGFRSYREMCALCHTPPGGNESPVTKGMNPRPTDLTKVSDHPMVEAELFWAIKNGIRMTGMPAWGPTHSDEELWDIVAFVKSLPKMSAEDYRSLDRHAAPGHSHGGDSLENDHHENSSSSHSGDKEHKH